MSANYELKNRKRLKAQMFNRKSPAAILIVDDDPDFLDLVCEHVSQIADVEIEVATSCEKAVSRLSKRSYQLVICDWRLASRTGPRGVLSSRSVDHTANERKNSGDVYVGLRKGGVRPGFKRVSELRAGYIHY